MHDSDMDNTGQTHIYENKLGYGDVPYRPQKPKKPIPVPIRIPQWVKDMRAGKELLW